jgi:hypothetical protein
MTDPNFLDPECDDSDDEDIPWDCDLPYGIENLGEDE